MGISEPIKITLINAGLGQSTVVRFNATPWLILVCIAIWNLIIATAASVNVDRFGRRPLFLLSVFGMTLTFGVIMGLSAGFAMTKKAAIGAAVVPFLFM